MRLHVYITFSLVPRFNYKQFCNHCLTCILYDNSIKKNDFLKRRVMRILDLRKKKTFLTKYYKLLFFKRIYKE